MFYLDSFQSGISIDYILSYITVSYRNHQHVLGMYTVFM